MKIFISIMSPRPERLANEYRNIFGLNFIRDERYKDLYVCREENGGRAIIMIQKLKDGEPFHPISFCIQVDSPEKLERIRKAIREYPYPEGHKKTDLSHEDNILSHKDIDGNSIGIIL